MTENNVYTSEQTSTSVWAVISLISGIANFIGLPFYGAVAALITGYVSKHEIEKSNGRLEGERMSKAGIILGWIGIAFAILSVCLAVLVIMGVIGSGIYLIGPISEWLQQIPSN
jgi:hypothetical protein